jgi:hypothetical protein
MPKLKKIIILFFVLVKIATASEIHESNQAIQSPGFWDMFTNLPDDWKRWGQTSFTKDTLPWISATLGASVLLYVYDEELWLMMKRPYDKYSLFKGVSDVGVFLGDGGPQFLFAGAFAASGAISKNPRSLKTASEMVEVILATGLVIQTLKRLTGRESPGSRSAECRLGCWHGPVHPKKYQSYVSKYDAVPSGHIATSLATLQVVIENYPEKKWIPYVGYPVIGVIGVGLVATSIHWWSDIPFGLLIGYSFSQIVTHKKKEEVVQTSYKPTPILKPKVGVVFSSIQSPYGEVVLDPSLGFKWSF